MSPGSGIPDQANNVSWWVSLAGGISIIFGFLAGMLGFDRKIESMRVEIKLAKEKAEESEARIEKLMYLPAKVDTLQDSLEKVLSLFNDSEGNQRIMTAYVCDKKASSCNLVISERMKHMGEMFGERINALASELEKHREMSRQHQKETIQAVVDAVEKIRQGARDQ